MTRITHAMVLAAGLGTRMQPLTRDIPKALVPVDGKPLINRIIDRLLAEKISHLVVNTHYKREVLITHLAAFNAIPLALSIEETPLETGGGLVKALPLLGEDPFFSVNCDSLWLDAGDSILGQMRAAFDTDAMDALLLLYPLAKLEHYDGKGDFTLLPDCRLRRGGDLVYTGIQVLHPRLFRDAPQGAFSLNILYDRAMASGRLFGLTHDGLWFHVSTPDDVRFTEQALCAR